MLDYRSVGVLQSYRFHTFFTSKHHLFTYLLTCTVAPRHPHPCNWYNVGRTTYKNVFNTWLLHGVYTSNSRYLKNTSIYKTYVRTICMHVCIISLKICHGDGPAPPVIPSTVAASWSWLKEI